MQREFIRLEQIADRENLLRATWKAARGKQQRPAVARFLAEIDQRINQLADAILQERAARPLPPICHPRSETPGNYRSLLCGSGIASCDYEFG